MIWYKKPLGRLRLVKMKVYKLFSKNNRFPKIVEYNNNTCNRLVASYRKNVISITFNFLSIILFINVSES